MKQTFYPTLGILLLGSLVSIAQGQKPTNIQTYVALPICAEGYNIVDYRNQLSCTPSIEKRSDTETIGNTSFTFSNYKSTIAGSGVTAAGRANDVFQYTDSYTSQILGSALVWRQNSTDTQLASEQGSVVLNSPYKAQVTITFNREVKNLRLTIQDIDKALLSSNQGSDFTDEVDFYPTDAAGNPVPLSGNGHSAGSTVLVGFGRPVNGEYGWYGNIGSSTTGASTNDPSTATCEYSIETRDGLTQAVLRGVRLNGKAASGPSREGNATIVFTKPVKKLVLTYRNLYTKVTSQLRLQTIAIEKIGWCRESNPLPVTLTTFDAKAADSNANLNWATASEANNDYFGVERSFDGVSFDPIGKVAGHGTTSTFSNYAYTDAGVAGKATGMVYYRLRQVDLDGTSTYSPVRTVSFGKGAASLKMYPNPATPGDDKLTLDLLALPQGDYQASLVNTIGSTVATYTVHGGEAQPVALPASLAPGTYIMVVQGQGVHLTQRLARQ